MAAGRIAGAAGIAAGRMAGALVGGRITGALVGGRIAGALAEGALIVGALVGGRIVGALDIVGRETAPPVVRMVGADVGAFPAECIEPELGRADVAVPDGGLRTLEG